VTHAATSGMNQLSCVDSSCAENCTLIQNPLNSCVKYSGGRSGMILTCSSSGYTGLMWDDNDACQGTGRPLSDQVGTCEQSDAGSFMNTCVGAVVANLQKHDPQPLKLLEQKKVTHAATSGMNQLSCVDSSCAENCTLIQNPLNSCVKYTGGSSGMILTCSSAGYTGLMWDDNDACQGAGRSFSDQVGTCEQSDAGSFMNTCVGDLAALKLIHAQGALMFAGSTRAHQIMV
jgi:hypothetical protein